MKRNSGLLMPIFSLPTKYGIGSFGKESYDFIDFLKSSGQSIWQILPLVQTGYGNSPYSSVCSKSFNPFFISIEGLKEDGLITSAEAKTALFDGKYIDYGRVYDIHYSLLRKAFSRFDKQSTEFINFLKKKEFYYYSLFMALKIKFGYTPFYEWEDTYKFKNERALKDFEKLNHDEVLFWQFVQFLAKKQWVALKKYANVNKIKILGDMPLYVAKDSVDVWVNPSLYKLDSDLKPVKVAGVPPDYFCEKGQLWGNPVYDYDVHVKDGFKWWTDRLKDALKIYDLVRIDHFRGLDRYYQVDSNATDAIIGEWVKVPGEELFDAVHKHIPKDRIVAEDLGIIDDGVRELLRYTGYPGMKILSFAFNGERDNLYLPENISENYVCYTGTHDNDTLMGFIENSSEWDYNNLVNGVSNSLKLAGINIELKDKVSIIKAVTELGFASKANTFIMPLQDVLALGADFRVNEPGIVKEQNWSVRFNKTHFKKSTIEKLKRLTIKYNR